MDKADLSRHIPPEALEAAAKRICAVRFGDWFWAMAHESQREDMRSEARAAIAAMLAAWPNTGEFTINGERKLVLPLEVKP